MENSKVQILFSVEEEKGAVEFPIAAAEAVTPNLHNPGPIFSNSIHNHLLLPKPNYDTSNLFLGYEFSLA